MNIGSYPYDEYLQLVKSFHGSVAPGMVIGGFMVDLALRHAPEGDFFDALCETSACLPDAIQLLTPCTVGNGCLKILDIGHFSLTLYEKCGGEGIRVHLDTSKVKAWPEIRNWYFRFKHEEEQDSSPLWEQIREAGDRICTLKKVFLKQQFIENNGYKGEMVICPLCHEAYPKRDGGRCRACNGDGPYRVSALVNKTADGNNPRLNPIPAAESAVGVAPHDMTLIIPDNEKNRASRPGQIIQVGDICRLQKIGRQSLNAEEENEQCLDWIRQDEAALDFARGMAGEGVSFTDAPKEGEINFLAAREGLFIVDREGLEMFNLIPGAMCASRQGHCVVSRDDKIAGLRAISLFIDRSRFNNAMSVLKEGPLFSVLPMRRARAGILVTGTKTFHERMEDKYIPFLNGKLEQYGCEVIQIRMVTDDRMMISRAIEELIAAGIDLLLTTAGLSVDADDVTRQGLLDAGATDMLYGMPVIPGAMTLLAKIGRVQVIGMPDCALHFKTTSFDLLLPRLLADQFPTREDLSRLGHGALCLRCEACRYPWCTFGK